MASEACAVGTGRISGLQIILYFSSQIFWLYTHTHTHTHAHTRTHTHTHTHTHTLGHANSRGCISILYQIWKRIVSKCFLCVCCSGHRELAWCPNPSVISSPAQQSARPLPSPPPLWTTPLAPRSVCVCVSLLVSAPLHTQTDYHMYFVVKRWCRTTFPDRSGHFNPVVVLCRRFKRLFDSLKSLWDKHKVKGNGVWGAGVNTFTFQDSELIWSLPWSLCLIPIFLNSSKQLTSPLLVVRSTWDLHYTIKLIVLMAVLKPSVCGHWLTDQVISRFQLTNILCGWWMILMNGGLEVSCGWPGSMTGSQEWGNMALIGEGGAGWSSWAQCSSVSIKAGPGVRQVDVMWTVTSVSDRKWYRGALCLP